MSKLDSEEAIQEKVQHAVAKKLPLRIEGGNTKLFYGHPVEGERLCLKDYRGIVSYEPTELVVTARAGTPLVEIEAMLEKENQMLACDPPHFGAGATWGGMVATGLSGSRRPFTGSVRDFVLGTKIINGRAEVVKFGGEVMKNVAGYDLSRLMAGSLGCLGVLLEISMKVLPKPECEQTIVKSMSLQQALEEMTRLSSEWLPLSGAAYYNEQLYIRFSGGESVVNNVIKNRMTTDGGEIIEASFWNDLNEHRLHFFLTQKPLWRIAVPPATPPMQIEGEWLVDWSGGLRWLVSDADSAEIVKAAKSCKGHATQFNRVYKGEHLFEPLEGVTKQLHTNLKQAMDPMGVFNPGRLYRGL